MNFPDRVPGIPDFTPIFDLIREERILSAILGYLQISGKKCLSERQSPSSARGFFGDKLKFVDGHQPWLFAAFLKTSASTRPLVDH